MRHIFKKAHYILFAAIIMLVACEDDNEIDPRLELLAGTWEVESVFLDGTNVTNPSYQDFAILFREDGSFFTVDGDPLFTQAGGFWQFMDNSESTILLSDVEAQLTYHEDNTMLNISLLAPGGEIGVNGRTLGLSGQYDFLLVRTDRNIEP
ncbi:MAG: hypothetical protein AAFQ94_10875 [Bacteroidota bacterium]